MLVPLAAAILSHSKEDLTPLCRSLVLQSPTLKLERVVMVETLLIMRLMSPPSIMVKLMALLSTVEATIACGVKLQLRTNTVVVELRVTDHPSLNRDTDSNNPCRKVNNSNLNSRSSIDKQLGQSACLSFLRTVLTKAQSISQKAVLLPTLLTTNVRILNMSNRTLSQKSRTMTSTFKL